MAIDIPFLAANVVKIVSGGWVPLAVALAIYVLMTTWKRGRRAVRKHPRGRQPADRSLPRRARRLRAHRVKGTAVFMTSSMGVTPPILLHHFKHNKVLHEKVILFTIVTEGIPEVPKRDRIEMRELEHGFSEVIAHYGFMQTPERAARVAPCSRTGAPVRPQLGELLPRPRDDSHDRQVRPGRAGARACSSTSPATPGPPTPSSASLRTASSSSAPRSRSSERRELPRGKSLILF